MIQPMVIAQMWPTPVAQQQIDLPEPMREALIEVLKRKDAQRGDLAKRAPDFHAFIRTKGSTPPPTTTCSTKPRRIPSVRRS